MHIDEKDFLQYRVNALISQKAELQRRYESMLNEYRELREKLEFIESGLPRPVTFDGKRSTSEYTLRGWLAKLKEDVAEVEAQVDKFPNLSQETIIRMSNEGTDYVLVRLAAKLTDVITVSTSTLDWLGWSVYGRLQKQKEVNEKNHGRGFWK